MQLISRIGACFLNKKGVKMIYFDSDTEKIELAKHIASIETENRMLKE